MRSIFINSNSEVRSGWKILGVMVSYFAISFLLSVGVGIIVGIVSLTTNLSIQDINNFITKTAIGNFINQAVNFAALIIAIALFIKKVDKKKFRDIGFTSLRENYKDLIVGLIFGASSLTAIFIVLLATKNITLQNSLSKPHFSSYTYWGFGLFIFVGIKEELLSRGYSVTALNQMNKPWLSIILSSLMFSALHLGNPNVKILGLINIVFVGVLFGYMFVKTKNIWMPIGYHITWNYFQGNVFGFPVSGTEAHGIYNINIVKDNLLTGGAFGPEAGILTTIVIALGILLVWKMPDGIN